MDLALLKQFIRIDGTYDDEILEFLKGVAEDVVNGALEEPELVKTERRYYFAVALLVSHYYDNREIVMAGGQVETPYGVLALIQQLRGV